MIITVASYKGGVAKTTTAMHLAAHLAGKGRTVLVDGDPNRSSLKWASREQSDLPFRVVDERQLPKVAREFEHFVIDTEARPKTDDLKELLEAADLLIVPVTPDALAIDTVEDITADLAKLNATNYRILLTRVPPPPAKDGEEAQAYLVGSGYPVLTAMVRRRKVFETAALEGVLVNSPRAKGKVQDRAGAWASYEAVAKEIGL